MSRRCLLCWLLCVQKGSHWSRCSTEHCRWRCPWLAFQAGHRGVCLQKEPKLCRARSEADKCLAGLYSQWRKRGSAVSARLQTLKQDQIVSSSCQNDSIESSCHCHLILKRHFVEGHESTASESRDKCLALQQDGEGRQTRATAICGRLFALTRGQLWVQKGVVLKV